MEPTTSSDPTTDPEAPPGLDVASEAKVRRRRRRRSEPRRRRLWPWIAGLLFLGMVGSAAAAWLFLQQSDRTAGELLRYAEKRLYGHSRLESLLQGPLRSLRLRVERPVPPGLPSLGKGVRPKALGAPGSTGPGTGGGQTYVVASEAALRAAMEQARAGDTIEVAPGVVRVTGTLHSRSEGAPGRPITLRASWPGAAVVELATTEGLKIAHAGWIIENLVLVGRCARDHDCEHAVHVVGDARGIVIRDNVIRDFNAAIKVNGEGGRFPDQGILEHNHLINGHSRETTRPVTLVDIVAASGWRVSDNVLADFVKRDGNGISYGVFMKGGGSQGRIERNLVVCTPRDISEGSGQPGGGARVGISMGGGGTGAGFCREGRCIAEHTEGVVANNVVAHCNDTGIDVNGSNRILVAHNTLVNAGGILIRNAPASATVRANLMEGAIRTRGDAWLDATDNVRGSLESLLRDRDALDLSPAGTLAEVETAPGIRDDFCGRPRGARSLPGALAAAPPCGGESLPGLLPDLPAGASRPLPAQGERAPPG